jgi:hypothetical protein
LLSKKCVVEKFQVFPKKGHHLFGEETAPNLNFWLRLACGIARGEQVIALLRNATLHHED